MGNKKSIFQFISPVFSSLLPHNSTVICLLPLVWSPRNPSAFFRICSHFLSLFTSARPFSDGSLLFLLRCQETRGDAVVFSSDAAFGSCIYTCVSSRNAVWYIKGVCVLSSESPGHHPGTLLLTSQWSCWCSKGVGVSQTLRIWQVCGTLLATSPGVITVRSQGCLCRPDSSTFLSF